MKFRQFLDTCLKGDEAVLGKLGGLAKKKPEDKKDEVPAAMKDVMKPDTEVKDEKPKEEVKKDEAPKDEKPKEEPKEEKDEDVKIVKADKKAEGEDKKKDDVKESLSFLQSLRAL